MGIRWTDGTARLYFSAIGTEQDVRRRTLEHTAVQPFCHTLYLYRGLFSFHSNEASHTSVWGIGLVDWIIVACLDFSFPRLHSDAFKCNTYILTLMI